MFGVQTKETRDSWILSNSNRSKREQIEDLADSAYAKHKDAIIHLERGEKEQATHAFNMVKHILGVDKPDHQDQVKLEVIKAYNRKLNQDQRVRSFYDKAILDGAKLGSNVKPFVEEEN